MSIVNLDYLELFSVISFVGNLYAVNIGKSSYAFYMPWTRFWELSLGAVLAYAYMFRPKFLSACTHKTTSNILSISGLVLIILPLIKFGEVLDKYTLNLQKSVLI